MNLNHKKLRWFASLTGLAVVSLFLSCLLGTSLNMRASHRGQSVESTLTVGLSGLPAGSRAVGAVQTQARGHAQAVTKTGALKSFGFDVVAVNSIGEVVQKRRAEAQYYTEEFGGDINLDMVRIPEGSFMMGTSFVEAERVTAEYRRHTDGDNSRNQFVDEYVAMEIPQRPVTVSSFFMGKFEVTQAQWRAVAQLARVNKDLIYDPSFFKGDDLPVEEITWEDAIEFCARLSRATGREYRLPSEAEWEYACRAGTTTQFHFGDTITPQLENCNGEYPYGSAPEGINRKKTTPVGSLGVANVFGLYDMHGNVKEWCMDSWHENYNGAPRDGRVWTTLGGIPWMGCGQDYRVVRGGSWLQGPCRSADRSRAWWTNNKNYFTGFRVVCDARSASG